MSLNGIEDLTNEEIKTAIAHYESSIFNINDSNREEFVHLYSLYKNAEIRGLEEVYPKRISMNNHCEDSLMGISGYREFRIPSCSCGKKMSIKNVEKEFHRISFKCVDDCMQEVIVCLVPND